MNQLSKSPQQEHAIYKIEGLEFLPEGFLELDPLLYKDEYTFESKIQEDMFNKQQRKIKALRRKQYQQKKKQKMRDVVIYVSDEKREKIIDFLEKWYFKNKRRMNQQEIEYCAGLLDCTKEKMKELQDNYLNQMKKQNTEDLRVYLHQKGQMDEQKVTLPISLAKYFVKSKNPYRGVSPRVYEEKTIYNPFHSNYMYTKSRNCKSQNFYPKQNKEHFVDKVFKDFDEKKQKFIPQKKVRSSLIQKQPIGQKSHKKQTETNFQQQFDDKIDSILNNSTEEQQNQKKVSFKNKNDLDKTLDKTIKKQSQQRISKSPKRSILKKSQSNKRRQTSPNIQTQQTQFKKFKSVLNEKQPQQFDPKNKFQLKEAKRVSIIAKTKEGNTIILQKLQPIQVGAQTYYQQIKDEQTAEGRRVSLITTDNQGRIVNQKLLNLQQIGNYYNNFAYRNAQIPQNVTIEVQNDLGQIVDIQEIFQHNAITNQMNDKKRLTLQNLNENQIIRQKNKTIHVLQPVNIAGEFYNNIVEQIIKKDKKLFRIITTDQNGTILENQTIEDNIGEQFYNEVIEGLVNEQGNKKVTLNLKNQDGKIIQQQEFLIKIDKDINNSEILDKSFRKSFVLNKNKNNRKFRVYSMPPIITGKTFLTQKIQEELDSQKGSMMTIFTFDEKGVELSCDIVNANLATENYSIQPVKNARGITIITKNDKGDIINIREVDESEYQNVDKDLGKDINQNFKGRQSIMVSEQKRNDSITRTYQVKPTVFANNYYKQVIEEVIDGKQKKYTVKTISKNEEVVSNISVNKNDFEAEEFYTEMIGNENGQSISVITRNEDNQILLAQEIEKRLEYLFNQQSLRDFDRKSKQKNSIISRQEFENREVVSYTIRPAKVNEFAFQQVIQDIIDKEGNKERLMITYDDQGQIVAADIQDQIEEVNGDLEQQFKVEDIDNKRKKITIVVNDESGKEIGIQEITIDANNEVQGPRKTTITNQDTIIIRNDLGLTQVGNKHYGSVVNEVIKDNKLQYIEVELQDQKRKTIAKKQIGSSFAGNYYDQMIKQIFIDSEGFQRPSIQIKNDKEQVLASFQDRISVQSVKKDSLLFQQKPMVQFLQNDIETIRKKNSTLVIKKLRPSYYQGRDYEFHFEEVIDPSGNRRLTLVTKRDNQEISRDKVDQKIANEEHENYIANLIQMKDRKATLEFRNQKGRFIIRKTLDQDTDQGAQPFDDFQEKFNEYGQRESQIFVKNQGSKVQKNHLLSPTLVGSDYYQQMVNEIVDKEQKTKSATVVTIDENGKKVFESNIPPKLTGKSYHSEVEENINNNGIRNFSLVTKNDKGTVVSKKTFTPNLNLKQIDEIDNEIIEEIVDFKDNKKINFIEDQKDQQFVLNQSFQKSNKDIELRATMKEQDKKNKNQYFEGLLKDYSFTNEPNRYSLNRTKQKDMRNTMHVNDIQRNHKMTQDTIKLNKSLTGQKLESLKDMPQEMIEIYDKFTKMENQENPNHNSNFDSLTNYQKDYINSVNSAKDKQNESNKDLDKAVSLLFNKEKEKIMAEIVQNLQQNSEKQKNDEDLIQEFQKFCRDVLPKDKEYKESIMLVSLFYYFLKKKKLNISQLNLQL